MDKIFKNIFFWITLGCIVLTGIFAVVGSVQRIDSSVVNRFERAINRHDAKAMFKCLPPEVQAELGEAPDMDEIMGIYGDEIENTKIKILQGKKYVNEEGQTVVPVIMVGYFDGECRGTLSVDIPVKKEGLKEYLDIEG